MPYQVGHVYYLQDYQGTGAYRPLYLQGSPSYSRHNREGIPGVLLPDEITDSGRDAGKKRKIPQDQDWPGMTRLSGEKGGYLSADLSDIISRGFLSVPRNFQESRQITRNPFAAFCETKKSPVIQPDILQTGASFAYRIEGLLKGCPYFFDMRFAVILPDS